MLKVNLRITVEKKVARIQIQVEDLTHINFHSMKEIVVYKISIDQSMTKVVTIMIIFFQWKGSSTNIIGSKKIIATDAS